MLAKQLYNPTAEVYSELDVAFDFFNKELFDNKLHHCLITLQREKRTYGYFSKSRFVRNQDVNIFTDEIALNPGYFAIRHIEETLSTLVHEMAHMYQFYFGSPGRRGYHNREWSDLMQSIGLYPTDNGLPTGKKTGESVSHVIIECGKFDVVCQKLLEGEYRLSWLDRYPPVDKIRPLHKFSLEELGFSMPKLSAIEMSMDIQDENNSQRFLSDEEDNLVVLSSPLLQPASSPKVEMDLPDYLIIPREDRSLRTKYQCPGCGVAVWGKPNLRISCIDCNLPLGITTARRYMKKDV